MHGYQYQKGQKWGPSNLLQNCFGHNRPDQRINQEDQMQHRIFCPLSGVINVPFVSIGSMDTCIVCTASSLMAVIKRDH